MLELIAMVADSAVRRGCQIEMQIRKGWVHKKFAGDRPHSGRLPQEHQGDDVLGLILGVSGIGMALIEARHGEAIVKLIGAAIWFAVAGIAFSHAGADSRHRAGRGRRRVAT